MPLGTNWASHHQYLGVYHLNQITSLHHPAESSCTNGTVWSGMCVTEHWALAVWIWPLLIIILISLNLSFLNCNISYPCPTDHTGFGGGSDETQGIVTLWRKMRQTDIALCPHPLQQEPWGIQANASFLSRRDWLWCKSQGEGSEGRLEGRRWLCDKNSFLFLSSKDVLLKEGPLHPGRRVAMGIVRRGRLLKGRLD